MADDQITIVIPSDLPPEKVQQILEAIGPDAIIESGEDPGAASGAIDGLDVTIDRLIEGTRALPGLISQASDAMQSASGQSIATVVIISLVLLAVAYGAEWAVRRVTPTPQVAGAGGFAWRLRSGALWLVCRIGSLAAFAVFAVVLSRLVLDDGLPRQIFAMVASVVLLQRVLFAVVDLIGAPLDPARRLVDWTDAQARRIAVLMAVQLAVVGALRVLGGVVATVSGGGPADDGVQAGIHVLWWLTLTVFFFLIRQEIAHLIRKTWGERTVFGRPIAGLAGYWPYFGTLLTLAVARGEIAQALGNDRSAAFGVGVILIFTLLPFVLGGLKTLRAERAAALEPAERAREEGWFALIEGAVILLAVVLLLYQWRIDPFDARSASGLAAFAPALVAALGVAIVGLAAWRAVRAFISAYEPEEEEGDAGGEGLGREGSRLGTALPVVRGFMLALIIAVTTMIALSALGINIGPLIAGAGIFGLAIGFGAQKLVSDVISGLFYLYEDAFRVGEYISTSEGKGVVEQISIRSARLRHHRGPLFTIPFGSMGTIQNHSRDWVKVKFSFAVPSKTDVEKVRKLVKKVGQKLSADPELEGKFIEPLKSQGAVAINGASYEIGVKYMCKPGEQFAIRRRAYAALQDSLRENGIELHQPSITVDTGAGAAKA